MKKIILTLISLFLTMILTADAVLIWEQTYGGEYSDGARDVITGIDGGFIMAGYTYSSGNGNSDVWLCKTDSQGNEVWSRTFGGSGWEYAYSLCQAHDQSGYVLTGYSTSIGNGARDVFVVGTDLEGNQLWTASFGGEEVDAGFSIIRGHAQDYVICGYTFSYGEGEDDIYVIGIDQSGNELWSSVIGCPRTEQGYSIRKTDDGCYILAAMTGLYDTPGVGSGRNSEIYLVKIDQTGTVIDENTFWGIDNDQGDFDEGLAVCQMEDGGYCIIGGSTAEGVEVMDLVVIKTDSELEQEWKAVFEPGDFYDFGKYVCQSTEDGNILICGNTRYAQPLTNDLFIMKLDPEGNLIYSNTFGGQGSESGYGICEVENGNYVIAGQKDEQGNGSYDAWLLYISGVTADFEAEPRTGIAPQTIDFTDNSQGYIDEWRWDFDNDGSVDSYEQDPSWVYDQPGSYSVNLEVVFGQFSVNCIKEDYIRIFDSDSALRFNDSGAMAVCPAHSLLNLTGPFTIEAWVTPENWETFFNRIIDKGVLSVFLTESFPIYNPYCLVVQMDHESSVLSRCCTPANSISPEGTQHLAVSYDGGEELTVHINGIEQELNCIQEPIGPVSDNNDIDLYIGNDVTGSFYFNGIIDEIRIWDHVRSTQQIIDNMLYYLDGNETGLSAYFKFNEGNGEIFSDTAGNTGPGNVTNAEWAQGVILIQTGSDIEEIIHADRLKLYNYPNPFNPETTFHYFLPGEGMVRIRIFNILGQLVETLVHEEQNRGDHEILWNTGGTASGIYYCQLQTSYGEKVKKFTVLK